MELATLGGGCFWCLEAVFEQVRGVERVVSGYSGGHLPDPSYEAVCAGATGHAEVVQIAFDPAVIAYRDLLRLFFAIHDPTTRNRQGNDVGTQYRSVVFVHSASQADEAHRVIDQLRQQALWPSPIVTEVLALERFYPAEDYHQGYFRNNPGQGYCSFVVAPKVAKFRKAFAAALKPLSE